MKLCKNDWVDVNEMQRIRVKFTLMECKSPKDCLIHNWPTSSTVVARPTSTLTLSLWLVVVTNLDWHGWCAHVVQTMLVGMQQLHWWKMMRGFSRPLATLVMLACAKRTPFSGFLNCVLNTYKCRVSFRGFREFRYRICQLRQPRTSAVQVKLSFLAVIKPTKPLAIWSSPLSLSPTSNSKKQNVPEGSVEATVKANGEEDDNKSQGCISGSGC